MPEVIRFDELTWPEVADLPRQLPLVLPIGGGYDPAAIAAAVGEERFALLPAVPYGWEDSPAPVGGQMLWRYVTGIFSGPQEEGFERLFIIHAGGEDLESAGVRQVRLERSADDAPLAATPERVVLIPCGHTEQHGYHLPLNTDTLIIDAIARGVVEAAPRQVEALPALPYGVSTHRQAFAGTFNVGGRVFEDWMLAVIGALVERGADRFYLISGHGGNCSFLVNAVKYAGERYRGIFAATAWLHTAGHLGAPALARYRRSARGGMGHACELETSYLLHLRPDLCRMERVVDETDFISTPNYYMDWIEGGALVANPPWEDDTISGSYGAGSLATAEHGARWLEAAIQEKVEHVREIHEQQARRLARRAAKKYAAIEAAIPFR